MNLRDLIIIYLACGAPFGVYYFLQNRNLPETKFLWLKSLFRFVCWIPFAIQMVARKSLFTKLYTNGFDKNAGSDAKKEVEIDEIKKYFEVIIHEKRFPFSIYEFRETFERYVGLTLEMQNDDQEISTSEKEIFRITNHTDKKLAEICLNRRNRKRLSFHQKFARRDFFEVFQQLTDKSDEPQNLFDRTLKLVKLLNDFEAQKIVDKLFKESLQTQQKSNVNNLEKELWNSEKLKPSPETKISVNMKALTATANLSRKD
jgi:hypothetical protein